MTVNISGLTRAAVLAALYNASRPQGMGFLQYTPKPMTEAEAGELLAESGPRPYFDYLQGRVMKIGLDNETELDAGLYDRDNGAGAAQRAIDALRKGDTAAHDKAHREATQRSIAMIEDRLGEESKMTIEGSVAVMTMGFSDVKEHLGPAIKRAKAQVDNETNKTTE